MLVGGGCWEMEISLVRDCWLNKMIKIIKLEK